MQLRWFLQGLHRWLGLALAAQLVLWMTSGVVMSLLPIALVRGETTAAYSAPIELKVRSYFPPGGVIAEVANAEKLELKNWLGREVYLVSSSGAKAIFDADTGERLSPINEAAARRVAASDFVGEGEIIHIALLRAPPPEYKGKSPVWRADFSDTARTRIYVSPETGEVVARRNRIWRFYDFFWMLHIMDYEERENFNNPLVRTFAITGLLFALTGLFLVMSRIFSGRYAEDLKRLRSKANAPQPPSAQN